MRGGKQPSIGELSSPEALHRKYITVGKQDYEKTKLESVQRDRDHLDHQLRELNEKWQGEEDQYLRELAAINHQLHGCLQTNGILVA